MPYTYQADCYCDSCGQKIMEGLKTPDDPTDEYSYDSDDYPKEMSESDTSDSPQHCGAGEDCLEAEELPSGRKIGAAFGQLTSDGYEALKKQWEDFQKENEVLLYWKELYLD